MLATELTAGAEAASFLARRRFEHQLKLQHFVEGGCTLDA